MEGEIVNYIMILPMGMEKEIVVFNIMLASWRGVESIGFLSSILLFIIILKGE